MINITQNCRIASRPTTQMFLISMRDGPCS